MKALSSLAVVVLVVACTGTPTAVPGSLVITEPIGMELVRVPAGEFLMGSDLAADPEAWFGEMPQHRVTLAEYYIGRYEVTNAQYAAFVAATWYSAPYYWGSGDLPLRDVEHPVEEVSWRDAVAFTQWLGAETGMAFRLCTEAEWEKACRGTSGLIYPWGDKFDQKKANITGVTTFGRITAVGRYSPDGDSPYGAADMAGNVMEWVADWYAKPYYETSPAVDPQGPHSGSTRVVRGMLLPYAGARNGRCAERSFLRPTHSQSGYGFRVCMSPGPAVSSH